ncbi:hypothetical protein ABZ589_32960 [Streptomyces sp. NPDC013313]|uniref:hypothetical protein n=1 Tax=Streptomyces sp. NPDC013313 TaxID=3155603 RepID=UPI0033D8D83E
MKIRKGVVAAVAGLALGTGAAGTPTTSSLAAPLTTRSQNCWYGGTHTTGGAKMQYYECRRTYQGRIQSSIKIRVIDTTNDGMCAFGRGDIGNSKTSAYPRVFARSCTTGAWSAWEISGWWNGNQGYEYVYLGH